MLPLTRRRKKWQFTRSKNSLEKKNKPKMYLPFDKPEHAQHTSTVNTIEGSKVATHKYVRARSFSKTSSKNKCPRGNFELREDQPSIAKEIEVRRKTLNYKPRLPDKRLSRERVASSPQSSPTARISTYYKLRFSAACSRAKLWARFPSQ
jgi:hypothetical protein